MALADSSVASEGEANLSFKDNSGLSQYRNGAGARA